MKLTSENVNAVATNCLFKAGELPEGAKTPPEGAVIVDGIISRYAFHPERLEKNRRNVASMLNDLESSFRTDGGGGMSFLSACMTRDGEHWGEHPTMGMLFALGMGLGMVSYTMPRDMWPILPGGVPYLTVDATKLLEAA